MHRKQPARSIDCGPAADHLSGALWTHGRLGKSDVRNAIATDPDASYKAVLLCCGLISAASLWPSQFFAIRLRLPSDGMLGHGALFEALSASPGGVCQMNYMNDKIWQIGVASGIGFRALQRSHCKVNRCQKSDLELRESTMGVSRSASSSAKLAAHFRAVTTRALDR